MNEWWDSCDAASVLGLDFSKVCGTGIWSWKTEACEFKHMFLQQLLRQKVFSIHGNHKNLTKINPPDLNPKKWSLDKNMFFAILAGIFPQASPVQKDMETLSIFNTRRTHKVVTTKLMQAMKVLAVTLLQGCCSVTGNELRGVPTLPVKTPEQSLRWYFVHKVYFISFVRVILVAVSMCNTYPGRRVTTEDLHRQLALMFMTLLEGRFTSRRQWPHMGSTKLSNTYW